MAPKRRPEGAQELHCLLPDMHDKVAALLEEDDLYFGFHDRDDKAGCVRKYNTTIKGYFKCRNDKCNSDGWASNTIAITIRMYAGAEYNARLYKQRCRRRGCKALGHPLLGPKNSYAERVAYRIKKWSGVDILPTYSKDDDEIENRGTHYKHLCEGCKAGRCSRRLA